jgi:FixJ family two-component response regulator
MTVDQLIVAVVDDDAGARRSLAWLIESSGLRVRTFCSAQEFLNQQPLNEVGCLVLDCRMPEMGGLELLQRLQTLGEPLPTVFVTGHGQVATCAQAFRHGAIDFLEKPVADQVLLDRVRQGFRLRQQQLAAQQIQVRYRSLTEREQDVLQLLCAGKRLKEIANILSIGMQTAAKHRSKVLEKMKAQNDVELAKLSEIGGLLSRARRPERARDSFSRPF